LQKLARKGPEKAEKEGKKGEKRKRNGVELLPQQGACRGREGRGICRGLGESSFLLQSPGGLV